MADAISQDIPKKRLAELVKLLPLVISDCANRKVSFENSMMVFGAGWPEPVTSDEALAISSVTPLELIRLLKRGK